jgi:hypothetical protein
VPTTFRLGVVSGSTIKLELEVEVEAVGVIGIDHSSSLAFGELAADDETSPRREGCFFRAFLARERDEEEADMTL